MDLHLTDNKETVPRMSWYLTRLKDTIIETSYAKLEGVSFIMLELSALGYNSKFYSRADN